MKLIKLKLQGQQLPVVLPPIMKQPPMFSPLISARFGMYAFIYHLYLLLSLILWGSGKDLLAQNDDYQTSKLSFIPLREEILIAKCPCLVLPESSVTTPSCDINDLPP